MSGFSFLGLILFSMVWLLFLAGMAVNWSAFIQQSRRKDDEPAASGIGPIPGVAGSIAMFVTVPVLMKLGIDVPWPWFWILLPLFIDPFCLGWLLLLAFAAAAIAVGGLWGAISGRR